MSVRLVRQVLEQSTSEGIARLVLLVLAHHSTPDGLVSVGGEVAIARVAQLANLNRPSTVVALERLRESGELIDVSVRIARVVPGGGA